MARDRVVLEDFAGLPEKPSEDAALEVLAEATALDTRRTESGWGCRFFCGDGIGDTMLDARCSSLCFFRGDAVFSRVGAEGEGVLLAVRCDESRADLRGV